MLPALRVLAGALRAALQFDGSFVRHSVYLAVRQLDAFFKAKKTLMEQLGVQTDAELCDALEEKFPDLFPKLH